MPASSAPSRRLSRLHRPEDLTLEEWQRSLRRQFGVEQPFVLRNLGGHPVFSDFRVTNPASGATYRVAIRSAEPGRNFCSCRDFTTNSLGTCKHLEFTLARLEKKRGGAKALRDGWDPPYSSVSLDYGTARRVRFRAARGAPPALLRLAGRWFPDGLLPAGKLATFDRFLRSALAIDPKLRVYDDVAAFAAATRESARRRRAVDRLFPSGIASPAFDTLLSVPLYDYQKEGILFAARAGRSLIGDEMGLGKTVQAIGVTEALARCAGVRRVLVVAPTSLKHQWEREIERLAPRSVAVIGGTAKARAAAFASDSFYKIMNYDTVGKDMEAIRAWSPELVILDEAQRIKNWSTRAARAVKSIESPLAIVLTGTPLENRLEELVSIVEFVDAFRLGPTYRFLHEHQLRDDGGRVVGYRNLGAIAETLAPIAIRRRKKEVLTQLPGRMEKNFFVPLTAAQAEIHEEQREAVARIVAKWRRSRFLSDADQKRLMAGLQTMRMVCDSTWLLGDGSDHGAKSDEIATLLGELLEDEETKVVVFSQWLRMHELLARRIAQRGWGHVLFHGGVESRKRKELVDRFRHEPDCRIFLSTDAGGVGLNLQHAHVVVNADLPWNPAVLEQRIGRVHRLGQRRPVQVVNFVAENAIEQQILSVLAFKSSLFAGVLDGGETEIHLGGSRLNRFMESVERVTGTSEAPPEESTPEIAAAEAPARAASPEEEAIGRLTTAAVALMQRLGLAGASEGETPRPRIETTRDEATGESYVKLPMPRKETVELLTTALSTLLRELS